MKKTYFKPTIKTKGITTEGFLADSISIGISEDPATGPALGKQQDFSGEGSSSVWDD